MLIHSSMPSGHFCLTTVHASTLKMTNSSARTSCWFSLVMFSQGMSQTNWNAPNFVLLLLHLNHPPLAAASEGWGGHSPPSIPLQHTCGKLAPWLLGGLAPQHSTWRGGWAEMRRKKQWHLQVSSASGEGWLTGLWKGVLSLKPLYRKRSICYKSPKDLILFRWQKLDRVSV